MNRNSLFILLGVVELILLSLIGLYFYQLEKKEHSLHQPVRNQQVS